MYNPIKMTIPEPYQLMMESVEDTPVIIEDYDSFIKEYYELTVYDEAGVFKKIATGIKDAAIRLWEWICKAVAYIKNTFIRYRAVRRAERMKKKEEDLLNSQGWCVIEFDDIPGDEYEGLFESNMDIAIRTAKDFAKYVVTNKKIIIHTACKLFPTIRGVTIAAHVTKALLTLTPIIADFITTSKEIALLQKKYEGKMKRYKNPDGTIRMEMPAEQYILIDKYRQLANRIINILCDTGGKKSTYTIEVKSTLDLVEFYRSVVSTAESTEIKALEDKMNGEFDKALDYHWDEVNELYNKRREHKINDSQFEQQLAVIDKRYDDMTKNMEYHSIYDMTNYMLSQLADNAFKLFSLYDRKTGIEYTIDGKAIGDDIAAITNMVLKPAIDTINEVESVLKTSELSLDSAKLIVERCAPILGKAVKDGVKQISSDNAMAARFADPQYGLVRRESVEDIMDQYYSEAVFAGGKEKVKPLVDMIQQIKDHLDEEIKTQEDTTKERRKDKTVKVKPFDPKAFWKNTMFKDFEDELRKIFGFRNVEIHPYIEKYISAEKIFESRELNCAVYHVDRFPVEGLITDNGFYDKSHSLTMEIYITLGLLKNLSAEEVLAVLLHEFGHSIDPAVTDIKYTQTNILSKYITDRKGAINKDEKRAMKKFSELGVLLGTYLVFFLIWFAIAFAGPIMDLFQTKEGSARRKLEKIRDKLKSDKERFNRQNYSEAFADNFARMYGYGHVLMSGLRKLSDDMDRQLRSRYKKEKARQRIIYEITVSMISDVHKTDIHRIRSLIKEYKADINDPNTPKVVKKQLEEDLLELEKVLDQYLNHKDEFQKRVNNLINDELKKLEDEDEKKEASKKDKEEKPKDDKDNK